MRVQRKTFLWQGTFCESLLIFKPIEKPENPRVFFFLGKNSQESSRLEAIQLCFYGNFSPKYAATHWLNSAIG
jgi:hypothetical protein